MGSEPAVLSKSQAFALAMDLNPLTEEAELEAQVADMIFSEDGVQFEFDKFLELIDFEDLALDEDGTLTTKSPSRDLEQVCFRCFRVSSIAVCSAVCETG